MKLANTFELDIESMNADSERIAYEKGIQPICSLCENLGESWCNPYVEKGSPCVWHCTGFSASRDTIQKYQKP